MARCLNYLEQAHNRSHHGSHCQDGKPWTVVDELLEAQSGQIWELQIPGGLRHGGGGGPMILWNLPPGLYSTVYIREKQQASCRGTRSEGPWSALRSLQIWNERTLRKEWTILKSILTRATRLSGKCRIPSEFQVNELFFNIKLSYEICVLKCIHCLAEIQI